MLLLIFFDCIFVTIKYDVCSIFTLKPAADRFCSWLTEMESNIEVIDQEVEKARAKYGDKDIPPDEIQNFKVSKLIEFHLYYYYSG